MTRSLPEWIATHDDQRVPDRVKLRLFMQYDGRCQCGCNRKIVSGESWQLDHKTALVNGGEHKETNLQPLLSEHHKNKTVTDMAEKSRTYQRRKSHHGLRRAKRPMPGGKETPFKKKISGEVVRR